MLSLKELNFVTGILPSAPKELCHVSNLCDISDLAIGQMKTTEDGKQFRNTCVSQHLGRPLSRRGALFRFTSTGIEEWYIPDSLQSVDGKHEEETHGLCGEINNEIYCSSGHNAALPTNSVQTHPPPTPPQTW